MAVLVENVDVERLFFFWRCKKSIMDGEIAEDIKKVHLEGAGQILLFL